MSKTPRTDEIVGQYEREYKSVGDIIEHAQQLKKGDRFTCEFGDGVIIGCDSLAAYCVLDDGTKICTNPIFLTRIPTHGERMQKVIDAAFDAENRLTDDETVQFRVGDMAEFVRYHCKLRDELDALRAFFYTHSKGFTLVSEKIEKLLKG